LRVETERLVLRPLSLDDLDDIARFYADEEVMRYIGGGGGIDRERTRVSLERMIENYEAEGWGQLGVVRKEDGAFMGRCGLLVWDTATWTATQVARSKGPVAIEVGYLFGQEYWGEGYATEAAIAVRDWAFANLGLKRLIALIYAENARSAGVARKLGMEPEDEIEIYGKRVTRYVLHG
jgi:ribosomal-protein-alanine N-acetyltransferase